MEMKDRIRQLMETQNMTQQTFASYIGMSSANLSNIFTGRTKPTLNTVEAIRSKFPNINIDWLMFGNGTMFIETQTEVDSSSTLQEQSNGEQTFDFGDFDSVDKMGTSDSLKTEENTDTKHRTRHQVAQPVQTDIVCKDTDRRKITEIRVFFDDQTWESFVPKK